MPEFVSPTDIGNRALQHCGASLINPALGFTENSKRAAQVSFAYGKLRQAELARNIWRFATKETCLRPIDSNTYLLDPTLFQSGTTYFQGSIVEDQSGTIWNSIVRDNSGNDPQNSPQQWEPYFGPLTVSLYDSSQGYFSGELVYTIAGDGTYNVFRSLISGNVVHPAMPNLWSTNTTYRKDQVVVVYPAWSSLTTYSQGQTVQYTDGNIYSSLTNGNLNNIPAALGANWVLMPTLVLATQQVPASSFSSVALPTITPIAEWNEQTSYSAGGFVLFNSKIYLAIANSTGAFPNAAASTSWVATTGGTPYLSLIDANLGNNPANAPGLWASGTTYAINALVCGSDGFIYKSLGNGNVGNNPTTDGGVHWQNTGVANPWTAVFTQGQGNPLWMQIGGAAFPAGVGIEPLSVNWPLGCGPASQTWTRNAFRLPAGFLRRAPQNPKAGSFSWLGAPANRAQDDWEFADDFLTSFEATPIILRFIADFQSVNRMPAMFCEALAARIALEVCEPLTQSSAKLGVIGQEYKKFITDAISVDGIDRGAQEPPLDDLIACRY